MQNLQNQARAAVSALNCDTELKREAVRNVLLLIDHGAGIRPFSLPLVIERLRAWQQNDITLAECFLDTGAVSNEDITKALYCVRIAHIYGFLADKLSALLTEAAPEA